MEFKAFLSHRYKSPEVNLYFHELFRESAEVQFEVDIGSLPTNVTRLERMIRDADAVIGIYPFPGDPTQTTSIDGLRGASKYFRLECELAVRSAKPTLVFLDKRYAPYFDLPTNVRLETFDIQEITGRGGSPRRRRFRRAFLSFCDEVGATMAAAAVQKRKLAEMRVGIIVPTDGRATERYEAQDLVAISQALRDHGVTSAKHFPWPPIIHQDYLAHAEELDWLIVDIGQSTMRSGIVGYLHGRFTPMIRLLKTKRRRSQIHDFVTYRTLFGGIEVGYPKDIVLWNDTATLSSELDERLAVLTAPVERINTAQEADSYFRRASLRKEAVFLSYSGRDTELALRISRDLKKRFQAVFDYKDGESITPGEPWLAEIFDKLSVAKLAVPLVSANYFASGNCVHEAQEMVAKRDAGELSLIPPKLYPEDDFERPTWMRHRQYMHVYDYPDIETVGEKLVEFFERSLAKQAS